LLSGYDLKRKIRPSAEKMPIFRNQDVRSRPFRVGGDEGIGRLQAEGLVLSTELKGDNRIFVNDRKGPNDLKKPGERLGWDIAAYFLAHEARHSNLMSGVFFDQEVKKLFRLGLPGEPQSKEVFVGIKNEKQAFRPRSFPESHARG